MARCRIATLTLVAVSALMRVAQAAPELCGNGLDDDADGYADEGCFSDAQMGICPGPLPCATTGDVGPRTGAFVYQLPADLAPMTPRGPSMSFSRVYMSQYAPPAVNYRTAMGAHWQNNWQSWLDKTGTVAVVHMTTGRDVAFSFSGTLAGYDYYTPQVGYHVSYLRQLTASPNTWELKLLTGEVYKYSWASPVGKLSEVDDTLATPNKISIVYVASGTDAGQISTVTDASGHKRFLFTYTSGLATSVAYQTGSAASWTTRATLTLTYAGTNPTVAKIAGNTIQTYGYSSSSLLASVADSASNHIIDVNYLATGAVANITTGSGGLGYDYNSTNSQCTGKTVQFYNTGSTLSCSVDSDCGGTMKCGGKTGTGATGKCYRAAQCLTVTSPNEDLVTTVAAVTPCTGACAPVQQYSWNTTTLDLRGVEKADGNWTSYQRDSNGQITLQADGDSDDDPTNTGGAKTWTTYGDPTFPGRATEVRTASEVQEVLCDSTHTGGCKRVLLTWESADHHTDGLLHSREVDGFQFGASGAVVPLSAITSYTYDDFGRMTQVDGPLAGSSDGLQKTYWTSSDVLKDGYQQTLVRFVSATGSMTSTFDAYDAYGNAGTTVDPDGTVTCRTWNPDRNYISQVREAMNGQGDCTTSSGADITTSFVRDSWLRLTKTTRPLGDCQVREYDSSGRPATLKLRDDCNSATAGWTMSWSYDAGGQYAGLTYYDSAGVQRRQLPRSVLDSMVRAQTTNPVSGYSTTWAYYADSQVDTVTRENGLGKTEDVWDAQNRESSTRRYTDSSTFQSWTMGYHNSGGTTARLPETVTDPASKTVTTFHDDWGRISETVTPNSGTTIFVHDAAGRLVTKVEGYGVTGQVTHSFTYDNLDRLLTEDYDDNLDDCTDGTGHVTEVQYSYDTALVSCPVGASCTRQAGRLAYVREKLVCDSSQPDATLDQETFYAYDDAGRLIQEYIRDDSARTASLAYGYDKNGNIVSALAPSGASASLTYGGTDNSDANLMTSLSRSVSGTPVTLISNVLYAPFGPATQYDQANTIGASKLHLSMSLNQGYRPTYIDYSTLNNSTHATHIAYAEDEHGRYTQKIYTNVNPGVQSDYLSYDWLDRVTCDAAAAGACPVTGTTLKTNVSVSAGGTGYNNSNDRVSFYHQDPLFGTYLYSVTQAAGRDQMSTVTQSGLSTQINYGWDVRGDRTYDDDTNSTTDRRDYTYDGKRRVRTVTGLTPHCRPLFGCSWQTYVITYAYDRQDRLIFRAYHNVTAGFTSQTYYYYDIENHLAEIKFLPTSDVSSFTTYDFYWQNDRPVAYWAVDQSGATARYFIHADEANRPLEVYDWPTSGDATDVWSLSPEAFGWDRVVNGSIYQPIRLNGLLFDDGSGALLNTTTWARPYLLINRGQHYDPMTETYLQETGAWPNESYGNLRHDVGKKPTVGQVPRMQTRSLEGGSSCRMSGGSAPCLNCLMPVGSSTLNLDNTDDGPHTGSTGTCWLCEWWTINMGGDFRCTSVESGFAAHFCFPFRSDNRPGCLAGMFGPCEADYGLPGGGMIAY